VSELSLYRLSLPERIRSQRILLTSDGHLTLLGFYAVWILSIFGVDLLLIVEHSSHVMSAFDVVLASPLKTDFSRHLGILGKKLADLPTKTRQKASTTREVMIEAMLNAMSTANLEAAFKAVGQVPIDREAVLKKQFIFDAPAERADPGYASPYGGHRLLTSDEGLEYLAQKQFHSSNSEALGRFGENPLIRFAHLMEVTTF
jgi:hypothetical protein